MANDIRAEYTALRDIAHKRVQRLEKAGQLENSSLRRYEQGIPTIKGIEQKYRQMGLSSKEAKERATKEIARETEILKRNLYSRESGSLKGVQQIEKRRQEAINEERERFHNRMKELHDIDEADELDRIWGLTNDIMSMMRAFHLDAGFYGIMGNGYQGYDKLSDRVQNWMENGGDPRNKFKAFRDIFGEELAKYDAGVQILEQMKTSSRRKNTNKIRVLGDALAEELSAERIKSRKKRKQ